MMKKIFTLLIFVILICGLTGCQKCPDCDECEECEECEVCEECPVVEPEDLTPAPEVTPVVYHWVPGALQGNVTATVDLKGAQTLKVLLGGKVLEEYLDYELDDEGELTIFGTVLNELKLGLGKHEVTVVTEQGTDTFEIEIVQTAAEATSIPSKTIKDIDFSKLASSKPTEVIANAPALLITEIGVDMYEYSYIEVFNNTNSEYSLKDHRIVFANLENQNLLSQYGLFEEPLGMGSGVFIYQDYKIPALSSAVIWLVASYPWVQGDGELINGTAGKVLSEEAGAAAHLFGNAPENLSIAKFREVYGLSEDVPVFPVRPQPCLMNGTSAGDSEGFGAAPVKAASSRFSTFNSTIDNRGVQIQKFDLSKKITLTETVAGFETAAYYKYDVGVLNKEEDVYTNGQFDRSKIVVKGGRETVNAFYARIAYYDAEDNLLGYASGANAIDTYNADKAAYLKMYQEIVTPVVTALLYGKVVDNEGVKQYDKWGEYRGLQYTLPESGSNLMRFIPLAGKRADYEAFFSNEGVTNPDKIALNNYKLSGVGPEFAEITDNNDILVFESEVYPTTYLKYGYNTIGRGIAANFALPTA